MQISVRGLVVLGMVGAVAAALVIVAAPLLAGAEAQTQSGKLTQNSLGSLLQSMGLKPQLEQQRYDFQFKSGIEGEDWNLTMSAVLSRDGGSIWVMAWLDELPKSAAEVPRAALLRLLADNDLMGNGKFFAYVSGNRRFVLQRVIPNQNLSSGALRAALLDLGGSVAKTYGHWSVAGWQSKQPAQTTAQNANGRKAPASHTSKAPIRNSAAQKIGAGVRN